tara:strand:- start:171 stop:644 length:474 start_codon:yes stop_codon:yes gene_type:complete
MTTSKIVHSIFKILPFILFTTTVSAAAPCNFDSKDSVIYEGKLESVRLIKKDIQFNPQIKDVLKCVMSIEARVKGKWYPSKGEYMFGPDMSQEDACGLAENRAKVKVMREVIPETLKSEKNLKCDLTNVKKSCKVIYMNVVMTDFGNQRVKMETCEK